MHLVGQMLKSHKNHIKIRAVEMLRSVNLILREHNTVASDQIREIREGFPEEVILEMRSDG